MTGIKKIFVLSKKEIIKLIREKSFIFVILAQLMVLSVSVTFSTAYSELFYSQLPATVLDVGVVGDDSFVSGIKESGVKVHRDSEWGALEKYDRGVYDAVIICNNFSGLFESNKQINIKIYTPGGMRSVLLVVGLKETLMGLEESARSARIDVFEADVDEFDTKIIRSDERLPKPLEIIYGILLPLLILSTAVISGNLTINLVAEELENKTIEPLLSAPVSIKELFLSKALTALLPLPCLAGLWMLILASKDFPISYPAALLLLSVTYGMVFVSIGIIAVSIAKSRDDAHNIFALSLLPTFALLLPLSGEWIEKLGWFTNIMPTYLITKFSLAGELSFGITAGLLVTAAISMLLFSASHGFAAKRFK
ncbi:MAG: hypothetical protein A7316_00505 [Candidatus Altiarchaeales archaeon WOR_SM1_86-2]|nr:MAG: hypothetical protein A7316_00505 [Candidatus Altiarchaeales archaeon WOR_SM1_86-2]